MRFSGWAKVEQMSEEEVMLTPTAEDLEKLPSLLKWMFPHGVIAMLTLCAMSLSVLISTRGLSPGVMDEDYLQLLLATSPAFMGALCGVLVVARYRDKAIEEGRWRWGALKPFLLILTGLTPMGLGLMLSMVIPSGERSCVMLSSGLMTVFLLLALSWLLKSRLTVTPQMLANYLLIPLGALFCSELTLALIQALRLFTGEGVGNIANLNSAWSAIIKVGLFGLPSLNLGLLMAFLFRMLTMKGLNISSMQTSFHRDAWMLLALTRRKLGLKMTLKKQWFLVTRSVPLQIWIDQKSATLRWRLDQDRARVIIRTSVQAPVELDGQIESTGALNWRDDGFAISLMAVPDMFDLPLLAALEFRDLKTNHRLVLPIDLPSAIQLESLQRIKQEVLWLSPKDTRQITESLLKMASSMNISRSPAVERLLSLKGW